MNRLGVFASTIVLALASCTPATTSPVPPAASATTAPAATVQSERRAPNQVLKVAKSGLPLNASPQTTALNNDLLGQNFDSLAIFGKNFEVKPGVATKWELRPADNAWRLTIRQGMMFSNGDKLTAQDVAVSINTIIEQRWAQLANISLVTKATAVDDATIEVLTKGVDATLPWAMPSILVIPAKYFQSMSPADFGLKPVGSGPYELVEFKAADRATYRLRQNYTHPYRKPIATEIQFLAIPDLGQQINGLRGGELDFVQGTFLVDQVDLLKTQGYQVQVQSAGVAAGLILQPEIEYWRTPLKDVRVRQALNYAINRQALADSIYKGYGQPAGQLADKTAPYFDANKKPFAYDVAKAKQLLAEAGYPTGFKLEGGIIFSAFGLNPNLVTFMQAAFREIGVDIPVNQMEQAAYTAKMTGGQGPRGDMSMIQVTDALGSFAQLPNLFDCSKEGYVLRWCNKEFDRMFVASKNEQDPAKRNALLRDALNTLDADAPYVLQVIVPAFSILGPKIRGFEWPTRYYYDFDTVYRIE